MRRSNYRILIFALGLFLFSGSALAEDAPTLEPGVWELVEISPVSMMDSNPRGFSNHREYYPGDGRLCLLQPSESFPDVKLCHPVRFESGRRIVSISDGSEHDCEVVEVTEHSALLQYPDGSRFEFRRLDDQAGLQPIKLQSLHVLQVLEGPQILAKDVSYLDPAELPENRDLVGAWEILEYRNVSQHDIPPYGFPNSKWVFDGQNCAQIDPSSTNIDEENQVPYVFDGSSLHLGGRESPLEVAFDQWGDLILSGTFGQMTLRQLTGDPAQIPALPVKICCLVLSDEDR